MAARIKNIEKAYPEPYRLARRFHELYEQSASVFGYETKNETKEFNPESKNGRLMAWVCYEIIKEEKQNLIKQIKKLLEERTTHTHSIKIFEKIINDLDLFDEDYKNL